jgi:hypothetical protein
LTRDLGARQRAPASRISFLWSITKKIVQLHMIEGAGSIARNGLLVSGPSPKHQVY